jgi:Chaperone of endosialidase
MKTHIRNLFFALASLTGIFSVAAQNTAFTYQGHVTDNGTNFNGTGQFQFALVTSTNFNHQALATANPPSGGFITIIHAAAGGNGYTTAPAVTISGGGGSGATAHCLLGGGAVTNIIVDNPGSGYTSTPTVTVAPPPPNISFTTFWSNDGTSVAGSEPIAVVNVAVNNGLFTVSLGDTTLPNMAAMDVSIFSQPNLQLRVWFNDGVNGFAALDPPQNLTTVPYAVQAVSAQSVSGPVSTSQLAGTIPASQLSGTISLEQLPGAVITNNATGVTLANATLNGSLTMPATVTIYSADNVLLRADANNNFFSGPKAGNLTLYGSGNTASGVGAFQEDTSGAADTAYGFHALLDNTSGSGNTAIGESALEFTTTGNNNTAVGDDTLFSNSTGANNVANGAYALYANTNGFDNTAIGYSALQANTDGDRNTAIGYGALYSNIDGAENTAVGLNALYSNKSGANTAIGSGALEKNTGGDANTAIGYEALGSSTSGYQNIAIGVTALQYLTTGDNNIAIGSNAGSEISTGQNNIDIGNAGHSDDNGVIRIGYEESQSATYLVGTVYAYTLSLSSDRNVKESFTPVNAQTVLAKVSSLPITEWNYKKDSKGVQHIGPMAQDFHAAFGLDGKDDKHISVIDEGGVALAAIQGLNEKLQAALDRQTAENAKLKQQNDLLAQRLNALALAVKSLDEKK